MKAFMDRPSSVNSSDDFAEKLSTEYDNLVKRGGDTINKVAVEKGNKDLMNTLIKITLEKNLSNSGQSSIISDLGDAFKAYWSGATMNRFPIPITPATGAIQNIQTTSGTVTNTGKWTPENSNTPPSNTTDLFLNQLISYIQIHLTTVAGIFQTVSLYPPSGTPSAGVVQWQGYTIN